MYTIKADKTDKAYNELSAKITKLNHDIKMATSIEEINFLSMELLVAEERLINTVNRGRR